MQLEDHLNDIDRVNDLLSLSPIAMDFVTSICGKHIGSGMFRSSFEYNIDDRFVVKVEARNTNCNIVEHMIWDEVKGLCGDLAWVRDWFAPVEWISPNGRILLMRKTKVHNPCSKKVRPDKVPAFLWDIKDDNFGWYGKNYVCHDYGQFYNFINYSKKTKKVDWDGHDLKIKTHKK